MNKIKKIISFSIAFQFLLTSSKALNPIEQFLLKNENDHPALKRIEAQIKKEKFYGSLRKTSSHLKKIIAMAENGNEVPGNYEDLDCLKPKEDDEITVELITLTGEEIEVLKKRVKRLDDITDGDWGDILLNGIAGKHTKYAAVDLVGNNKLNGIKKGIALLLVGEASNAAGSIVEDFSKKGFGKIFNFLENSLSILNRIIFHKGKRPFTHAELNAWKELISKDLREIEQMIKSADRHSSRGKEEILRMLESEVDNESEKAQNLWLDFITDLASTCEQLAQEIQDRQKYYKSTITGFGITNTANHLINKLLIIKNWLTSVNSVKDFAALPESKQIVPAMKRSIENYFNNLLTQIKPLNAKSSPPISNSYSSSRKDRWDQDDNDYPGMLF